MDKTIVLENTGRRDALIALEQKYQAVWEQEKTFHVDPPAEVVESTLDIDELARKYPKFMGTMAFPYMNGTLHVGHTFTLSKVDFAVGYERMMGKRALFPLGFHCTGLPIKAAADKLVRELEMFGPDFQVPEEVEETASVVEVKPATSDKDVTKFKSNKSKAAAKTGKAKYQFEIMLQLGLSKEEVRKFADANHWLEFFPPLTKRDTRALGCGIDWRRSFVTTDANPYFDRFVHWQLRVLKDAGKIKFGERYTIYSAKDGQPCMDHDRSSGEGVNPQEYTGIKIEVIDFADRAREHLASVKFDTAGKHVFLVAATLRPETMYGQTCCFVSPTITYGVFDAGDNNYYICTERAFKNMCFQKLTPRRGHWKSVVDISGADLVGSKIRAPLAVYPELYVLPMDTILPKKGTGVVTSVPSDSPDDFITMADLQKKPEFYGIRKEWAAFEPVSVLRTPTYGDLTAGVLIEQLKIRSPKDSEALAKAKELAYKEGFFQGVMTVGKYSGERVEVAKPKVKQDLIDSGEAFNYSEPEGAVVSRSGDECVVSLEDQWYTDYGEPVWRAQAEECVKGMQLYSPETRNALNSVLDWLKNWALSRTYGLGSHIPWDPKYLCESLSDSTVYPAYYTVSHLLHADDFGRELGPLGIKAEDMTDNVWDYIFDRVDSLEGTTPIPQAKLDRMRREFQYFYPLDVRVSGKDLIGNHLTFYIYCHVAIFKRKYWPRGIRCNGHLMLNNEKMSKSTGNFMTLEQCVSKFGADATRIAIADAGDSVEDANFDEANANAAILRLYVLKGWAEDTVAHIDALRDGPKDSFLDRAFENEMNELVELTHDAYDKALYRNVLKHGLFDFQAARDYYRDASASTGHTMHRDLVLRYIETQALLLVPIAPHFAEYIWREVLHRTSGSIRSAPFATVSAPVDRAVSAALHYVRDVSRSIREAEGALIKKKVKSGPKFDPKLPSKLTLYIASAFPEWQDQYIELVRQQFESSTLDLTPEFKQKIGALGDVKRAMPFVNHLKSRLAGGDSPETVFNRKLVFSESDTVKEALPVFKLSPSSATVAEIQAVVLDAADRSWGVDLETGLKVAVAVSKAVTDCVPGSPAVALANVV